MLATILMILELVAALPAFIQAVKEIWDLIRGVSNLKERRKLRGQLHSAVIANVNSPAKTYSEKGLAAALFNLHGAVHAQLSAEFAERHDRINTLT